jgi:hypothetical protein
LRAAIIAALPKRDGQTVVSDGAPVRWNVKEAADCDGSIG